MMMKFIVINTFAVLKTYRFGIAMNYVIEEVFGVLTLPQCDKLSVCAKP